MSFLRRNWPMLSLYLPVLAIELLGTLLRWIVLLLAFRALAFITARLGIVVLPWSVLGSLAFWLSPLPIYLSLAAFIHPGTGWIWRQLLGARRPSEREADRLHEAFEAITEADPSAKLPRSAYVLDVQEAEAMVLGKALVVSRALLNMDELEAAVAHEVGHITLGHTRTGAALSRLYLFQRTHPTWHEYTEEAKAQGAGAISRHLGRIATYATSLSWGGAGVTMLGRPISSALRRDEYQADDYAARLGYAADLADLLEVHGLIFDTPIQGLLPSYASHPYIEHRIERLERYERGRVEEFEPAFAKAS